MEKECRKLKSKMSFSPGPWFFKPQDTPQVPSPGFAGQHGVKGHLQNPILIRAT